MIRLAAVLFYLILSSHGSPTNQEYLFESSTEGPASDCGPHCYSVIKTMIGHVKDNQNRLVTCEKETRMDLSRMNSQLTDVKKTLSTVKESLESREKNSFEAVLQEALEKHLPRNLESRLNEIDRQLAVAHQERQETRNLLTEIHNTLSRLTKVALKGTKFYYIGEQLVDQNMTETCHEMGGQLMAIQMKQNLK